MFVRKFIGMMSMSCQSQEKELTPQEREMAHDHWQSLMFADSRSALEKARLGLLEAPPTVRQAVMNSITDFWLRNYEPNRDDNPFK